MMETIIGVVLLTAVAALFYILYSNGYMPVKSMGALYFVGTMGAGTNQCSASFKACTGQIKRVLRFRQSKTVNFTFKGNICKGDVEAFLLNRDQSVVLMMNSDCPEGTVQVLNGPWYYLVIRFNNAEGDYTLQWN